MSKARCKYCGRDIKYVETTLPPDKYYIIGEVQQYMGRQLNGYTCPARHPGYEYDQGKGHEPITKEEQVLEILRNYRESKM